jgi:hypothetical protein
MLERRLIVRLLGYWEDLCNGQPMMAESKLNTADLQDVWEDCFLIRISDPAVPSFEVVHRGANLHASWPAASDLVAKVRSVIAKRSQVMEDEQLFDEVGTIVKYRQCLLPLGENGQVTAILGGARFKKFDA